MDSNKNMLFSSPKERLHSFFSNPLPLPEQPKDVEPNSMKFAEAGFERTKPQCSSTATATDEVYCRMCGLKYSGWSGESPWVVHRTLRPNCLFLNTPSSNDYHSQSFTSQISLVGSGNTLSNKSDLTNLRKKLFPKLDDLASKIKDLPEIQHPFQPKRGTFLMLFESLRLLTFDNPQSKAATTYAKAGFVYDVKSSCAVCIFCNVEIEFKAQEQISLEFCHEEQSPSCPFICNYDVENISREDERFIREKSLNSFLASSLHKKEESESILVKHPEFHCPSSRLGTFKSWPPMLIYEFPVELMVQCGFYFTNRVDSVRCYSCGIGLCQWEKGTDPFSQHAKVSPHCWHILQVKGQEFVDVAQNLELTVKVDHRETQDNDEPERAATTSSSTSLASVSSSLSLPSSMKVGSPLLDMDSIEAAMACQYTIEQIADAVIKFFVFSSGRYPNEDLLLGTLRAADVNHKVICEQQQEIISKDSELEKTKTELQSQRRVNETTKSELARTQHTLEWQNSELRTELVGQIQQQSEALHHKDEVIYQKDEVIYQKDEMLHQQHEVIHQKDEVIQNKDIQLELKNREVEDLQRHLKSVLAALEKEKQDKRDAFVEENEEPETHQSNTVHEDEFPVANCKVCLTNTSQIVFYPCKHLCCCDTCATRLYGKSCPICREPNLKMEKVYVI